MSRPVDRVVVEVVDRQRRHRASTAALSRFVRRAVEVTPGRRAAGSVVVCLVSDRRIRALNDRFRGVDRATDVLSFPAAPDPTARISPHLGDIVIGVGVAARQAREAGRTLARELRVLALHGWLHLLGYDHERDDGAMMRLQRRLERRLFEDAGIG